MRVAVVGAGAIGGFLAAALAKSGVDVAVTARGAHLAAIRARGLTVRDDERGDFTVALPASHDLRELGAFDVIFVAVKAHQWPAVLEQFEPYAHGETAIVTLQNGLPFWYFRDRAIQSVDPGGRILGTFAYEQLIGGVVHTSGSVIEPGVVHHSGRRLYPIGELDGSTTARIEAIAALFAGAGLEAPVQRNIRRSIWNKVLGNASLNPVSALTRATIAQIVFDPGARMVIGAIMREALDVATATGVDVATTVEERIAMVEGYADVKTSMLQDVEAGRELELEPICGAVVELADEFGINVPALRTVYGLTKLLGTTLRR